MSLDIVKRPNTPGYYWLLDEHGDVLVAHVDADGNVLLPGIEETLTLGPDEFLHIEGTWIGPLVPPLSLLRSANGTE